MNKLFLTIAALLSASLLFAQTKHLDYEFEEVKDIKTTSVKDQHKSGTCWSFSTTSFLETELIRMGKGEWDLSEMHSVYYTYADKAERYVRMHGHMNFGAGGAFHDVINAVRGYGILTEEAYTGLGKSDMDKHYHFEMDAVLKGNVDAVIKNKNKKLSPVWHEGFTELLDTYLGEIPETFTVEGTDYTPESFRDYLEINPDDYIELTSFSHVDYYDPFVLAVPDNWSNDELYNVPLEDMQAIFEYALSNGYSIAWASDVTNPYMFFSNSIATVPDVEGFEEMKDEKRLELSEEPHEQKEISMEMRQKDYDNWSTGDDHGMHITGLFKDQLGEYYYKVKNSWGPEAGEEGYFYASEAYILYKTTTFMVHKDGIPEEIRKKLGIE